MNLSRTRGIAAAPTKIRFNCATACQFEKHGIIADRGCRGYNAPATRQHKAYIAGCKHRNTGHNNASYIVGLVPSM